jgi:hypothetical protein
MITHGKIDYVNDFIDFLERRRGEALAAGNPGRAAAFAEVLAWVEGNRATPIEPSLADRTSLTIPEAARVAHLSPMTIYRAVRLGELATEIVGGGERQTRRRVRVSDLEDWLIRLGRRVGKARSPGERIED